MKRNTIFAKLKRTLTSILPIDKNRIGKCKSCGACCKLPWRCMSLRYDSKGKSYCVIYPIRWLNCRKYPRCKEEQITERTCGYRFK